MCSVNQDHPPIVELGAAGLTGHLALLVDRKEATEDNITRDSGSFCNKSKVEVLVLVCVTFGSKAELGMRQFFGFATTTTRQCNIASGTMQSRTRKKSKNS